MSHFSLLVVGENAEQQLAPFHEFECTGRDDQFVQTIDETEEARAEYERRTEIRIKSPDGSLHSFFDEQGNWRPGFSMPDPTSHVGDRRTYYVPAGYEKVEVPARDVLSFEDWASDYYGREIIRSPSLPSTEHKYGHICVDTDGSVRVIRRTNPNKKWDWFQLGGRWTGALTLKEGASGTVGSPGLMTRVASAGKVDAALKGDVDFDRMRLEARLKAAERFDRYAAAIAGYPSPRPWPTVRDAYRGNIEAARAAYHAQPALTALRAAKIDTFDCPFAHYGTDRDAYLEIQGIAAGSTYAILRNGEWIERGRMGWFGMAADEKEHDRWLTEFWNLVDVIPDQTLLSVYDCHI